MADNKEKNAGAGASAEKKMSTPVWVAIAVVCALLGGVIGHFALGSTAKATGSTTISESDLDSAVASFTYNGKTTDVTARDVISYSSSLSASLNEDGTYNVPSADGALSVARTKIIEQEAESRGITVSDDDISAYAQENLGESDLATIASTYGLEEDAVKELIKQSDMMSQLREQVVTEGTLAVPTAPTAPAEGEEETATAEYAQYIIALAGDEWDATAADGNGAWAASDSAYATALGDYEVTNDSATYEAAQAAYYLAYQQYSTEQTNVSEQWTAFVNGLFSNATITLYNLVA